MKITNIKDKTVEITSENYENIFNIYTDENDFYYYNLLKKVDFPIDLNPDVYDYYEVKTVDTYPSISYKFYKSVTLWWLICASNQIDDPMALPSAGTLLKIIKPFYVQTILTKLGDTNE